MSEEEKPEAIQVEGDFPSLDLVYDLCVADYEVVERRCTAGADRAGVLLTVEVALSGAAIGAMGRQAAHLPWWVMAVPAALCIAAYIVAARAALLRGLRLLVPATLARDYRKLSQASFKEAIVFYAAEDSLSNRTYIRKIWRLLVASVICFVSAVVWSVLVEVALLL